MLDVTNILDVCSYRDEMAFAIMGKLLKQRKESIKSYQDAGRTELAESERLECEVIGAYLPKQLSPEEIDRAIEEAIGKVGATTVKDMGKVSDCLRALF